MALLPAIGFRSAEIEDAQRLAGFQIRAWAEHYRAFLSEWTLDRISLEDRAEAWRMILRNPERHGDTHVFLAETAGHIIGFGACGFQRSERLAGLGYGGEVSAIYVDRARQSQGLERNILRRLFIDLSARGERRASLWVIRENRAARGFAEARGAILLDPGVGGRYHILDDVAYGWRTLDGVGNPAASRRPSLSVFADLRDPRRQRPRPSPGAEVIPFAPRGR